jgi:beta-glucosidase
MKWPPEFMWGTGASSTQCEGAAPASDWWDWEREDRAPLSGDGNGFADRYAEDFAALAALGLVGVTYRPGQALFDPHEPGSPIARCTEPFSVSSAADLKGQVDQVCFAEGLALFNEKWFLY